MFATLDTDLSFSGRRTAILSRYFFVTGERLVLRDNAQEANFVVDTFVVFTNAFHQPAARIYRDLRVECLIVASDAFNIARRSEEVREIFNFKVITDVECVERARKILLVGYDQRRFSHQQIVGHERAENLLRALQVSVVG